MADKQRHPLDVKSSPRRPTQRSASMRKLAKDGATWTPTEARKRDGLMRQFSKRAKGYAVAISEEYREGYEAIDWSEKVTWAKCPACEWRKGAIGPEERAQARFQLDLHWRETHESTPEELEMELTK